MKIFNSQFEGINDLIDIVKKEIGNAENPQEILEAGAKMFGDDLLRLPKPMSKIKKSGYVHMVNTFSYRKAQNNEIDVGWGKYYGLMVEKGTTKMSARPHMKPLFDINKEKYYSKMLQKMGH